jgi:hypothetical protein
MAAAGGAREVSEQLGGAARQAHGAINLGEHVAAVANVQAKQVEGGAKNLVAGAGSSFHVEPAAAATLIKSCQDALDQLDLLVNSTITLHQAPQLGTSPGANVISKFTQDVATDSQGILPAIISLKATLNDMIAAYRKASTNYAETEAHLAQSFQHKP